MNKTAIITTRAVSLEKIGETRDCLDQKLVSYVEELGYLPCLMPNFENIQSVERLVEIVNPSLIVLSGGNNISPALYGSTRADVQDVSITRDAVEKKLLEIAVRRNLKVLGICRGMQMINVYFGGTLCLIKDEIKSHLSHVRATHSITLKTDDFMPEIKEGFRVEVNSYHDYGFTSSHLGQGLIAVGKTDDSVVEIIKHRDFPIFGIMWHPERQDGQKEFLSKILNHSM